jgi:ubiquinone/menaquinone biosynthesis C-methylase UbiE
MRQPPHRSLAESGAAAFLIVFGPWKGRERMNETEYRQFYHRVGRQIGWDFSKVKCISEGVKWDFYDEVARRCKKSDILLDIGTGGGENLFPLADSVLLLVGIDNSASMVEAAKTNLASSGASNVRFWPMDAAQIEFPDRFFDVISCRQAPFCAQEAARVLADDGLFFTQQVSEDDKLNLKEAFGRNRGAAEDGTLKHTYIEELKAAGFGHIQVSEYDATEYYETDEDLLFLLKHAPIVPNFGESESDFVVLRRWIEDHRTEKGIRTNSKRFMIKAQK